MFSNYKVGLKKRIFRDQLPEFMANLPKCKIVMESCGGSNYWARVFQKSGPILHMPFLVTGAPGEIRTPDLLVRSQVLYPAELRARFFWRRGRDSNPRWSFRPHTPLAGERLQPLGHLSSYKLS